MLKADSYAAYNIESRDRHVKLGDWFGTESKYILYKFNLANEENSQEDQSETPKIEPILGHCSNLLKIEISNNYIYTGEQGEFTSIDALTDRHRNINRFLSGLLFSIFVLDEKVRISLRKHPFVIEQYLLGHSEFISDFKLTKENTVYYSTSGDGTCIKWKGTG